MFYYFNIYICISSPYFWVCNLGISNTHVFSVNGIVELTENIIQDAYRQNVIIYILHEPWFTQYNTELSC